MAHCSIPLELWHKIFLLACTDGGATGAALAQVSTFFQAASLPVRLHSLAFTSLHQLESFLVFMDVQQKSFPSHGGPKVRHMLIGDFHAQAPSRNDHVESLQNALGAAKVRRVQWDTYIVSAITQLLHLVAPNLRTLSVVNHHTFPVPLATNGFPLLEELTLFNMSAMFPTSETTGDAEVLPLLPSLKRLHVIHASGGDMSQIFRTLPLLAPNLSHLRFSSARVPLSFLLDFLRNAMGMPDTIQPPPGSDPNVRPSYPSLQYIIVHAVPLPRGGWCGTPRRKYESVVHVLNQVMACHGQGEGLQFVILKGRAHRARYWAKRAKKDWLESMTGQRGCWTLQHWVEGSRCTVDHYDDSDDDVC